MSHTLSENKKSRSSEGYDMVGDFTFGFLGWSQGSRGMS